MLFSQKKHNFIKLPGVRKTGGQFPIVNICLKAETSPVAVGSSFFFPSEVTERKMEIKSSKERAVKKLKAVTRHWLVYVQ